MNYYREVETALILKVKESAVASENSKTLIHHIIEDVYKIFTKDQLHNMCQKYGEDNKKIFKQIINDTTCYFITNLFHNCKCKCHKHVLKKILVSHI